MLALLLASTLAAPDLTWVATVERMGISPVHVSNVLRSNGLEAVMVGSLAIGILAPNADAAEAQKILMADAKIRPYHYLDVGDALRVGIPDSDNWTTVVVGARIDSIDRSPALLNDKNLKELARRSLMEIADLFSIDVNQIFVSRMKVFPMDYLANDFVLRKGYAAEVTIAKSSEPKQRAIAIGWVWNDGQEVAIGMMGGDID